MVLLSELISRVRIRYEQESGGSSARFSDQDMTKFANEGLEMLAEATGFYERYCTIPLVNGQTYYDVRGFTPETVVSINSVWSTSMNDWLKPVATTDLPSDYEDASGEPYVFTTRGIYWLMVYPRPTASSGYIRVYFKGIPHRATHTQYVLGDMPDSYVPALEEYMLYEIAALDRLSDLAIRHWQEYSKREDQILNYRDHRISGATAGRFGQYQGVSW